MTPIIEMMDYTLASQGTGQGIRNFYFPLFHNNICTIEAQNPDDANTLLRAIATLIQPLQGRYHFRGKRINFRSDKEILACKSQIAYIATNSALISNMTIRQNLLLQRYYFENDLTIDLDDTLKSLCEKLNIRDKLDKRPAELNNVETQAVIAVREISKKPLILLIERPENFVNNSTAAKLSEIFIGWIKKKKPVVFISYDHHFIRRFANRKVLISNGTLTVTDI